MKAPLLEGIVEADVHAQKNEIAHLSENREKEE